MQSIGERQRFTGTNKIIDDLISNLGNFKASTLIEIKDNYFY